MRRPNLSIPRLQSLTIAPKLQELLIPKPSFERDDYRDEHFYTMDPYLLLEMFQSRRIDYVHPVIKWDRMERFYSVQVYVNVKDTWKLEVFRDRT